MTKGNRTRSAVGIGLIVAILIWDFVDGFKGDHSILLGFASVVGGVISFLTTYWLLETLGIVKKHDEDSGPTVI